jgi:spermidine synthase
MSNLNGRLIAPGRGRQLLVYLCFTLSGLAGLIYQTAWTRQFALVFGTSELAVATVLAAYMGGLAIGARVVESLLPRIQRPVRLYALLELAIGLAGLALVPACLYLAERLLLGLLGGQNSPPSSGASGNTLFYLVAAFLTLLLPTTLMGATLPLLVRDGVHSEEQIGDRVGKLYACNTAGAVAGALLAALLLLPALGLRGTLRAAVAVNALAFLFAWLLQRGGEAGTAPGNPIDSSRSPTSGARRFAVPGPFWILPLIFLSGAIAFLHEVLWTRLLQRVEGSSIQAFGVMVASFLCGIALGGALGARLARERTTAARAFAASQIAVALAAIGVWYALNAWAADATTPFERVGFGLVILLPLALAIGVSYPLAVRILASDAATTGAASARVYAWNTSGAIVGALVGGFWLIPALRYEGAVQLAVWISLALALLSGLLLLRPAMRQMIPIAVILAAVAVLFQPDLPENLLKASILRSGKGTIVYYGVGRTADVVAVRNGALLDIRTNGLPEAGTTVLGAPPAAIVEAWMSTLAVLARPDSRTALIIGFGGGNVVQAMPPAVRDIDVIELEPQVMEANRAIAAIRAQDPLTDARVNLIYNDARGALALSNKRYDILISQPSHPWTAGSSHLYTREFMAQAKRHLNDGGVFVQWMDAQFIDTALLRSLMATLLDVFREVRVYRPAGTTLLYMASDERIQPEHDLTQTRAALDSAPRHYARLGLNSPEDLIAALAMETADARIFAASGSPVTDDDNRLAMANVYERQLGMSVSQVSALLSHFDPLTSPDSFVYRQIGKDISFEYLWRRNLLWSGGGDELLGRVRRMTEIVDDSDQRTLMQYMMSMHQRQPEVAAGLLAAGLKRWPESVSLHYAETEAELARRTPGDTGNKPLASAAKLTGEPAMVVAATLAASRQQWAAVAALDEQLAQVPVTAQWEPQAQRLRAEWRMRVNNRELRQRFGDEGIAITDRAEVNYPDVFWHALRAWSAAGTDRPEVVLESVAAFCTTAASLGNKLAMADRQQLYERALSLQQLLGQLRGDGRIDGGRAAEVREHLDATVRLLEKTGKI